MRVKRRVPEVECFVPRASLTKGSGVRRQAVFRATPLFEQEFGGRAARKSGAATRAQRGSCHRTPKFLPQNERLLVLNFLNPKS